MSFPLFPRQILILITIVSMASKLPCYVFCICLLTNKYQKYKSVELGDQLQHGQHQHCHHFDLLNPCQSKSSPGLPCSSCVLVGRSSASSPLSCWRSSLHTGAYTHTGALSLWTNNYLRLTISSLQASTIGLTSWMYR